MQKHFLTSFESLVAIIVARSPDADLWLPFESQWRKSVMRVLFYLDVVWYLVPSLIAAWIYFRFG